MNARRGTRIAGATVIAAAVIGGVTWLLASSESDAGRVHEAAASDPRPDATDRPAVAAPAPRPVGLVQGTPVADPGAARVSAAYRLPRADYRAAPVPMVRVRGDERVANVNGVVLTGRDLGIVDARELSPERHAFLLEGAIEHELAQQAASEAGITLSDAQQRALDRLREQGLERDPRVGDGVGATPEAVEHDLRAFTTAMLLESLLTSQGGPSRHVTQAQVEAYFASHAGDFDPLPVEPDERAQAWQMIGIAIRQRLARDLAQDHEDALAQLRASMRANASVDLFTLP